MPSRETEPRLDNAVALTNGELAALDRELSAQELEALLAGEDKYYRVGNVIINRWRWGDIGYRLSHADLIRW
jgi:hypothetical protein